MTPSGGTEYPSAGSNQIRQPRHVKDPFIPAAAEFDDDISQFRRIHTINSIKPVETLEEANALLKEDSENANALQFIAWFDYPHRKHIQAEPRKVRILESIVNLLERSITSGTSLSISLVMVSFPPCTVE